jgi:TolB-like protein/DNA-binding SARP family transcriptional activator
MTHINLLGPGRVLVDGKPLEGEAAQRRRLALLAVLAMPPLRAHTRDRLLALLWPENDTDSARHLLSASLHVIRKGLGPAAIVTDGDTIALGAVGVDVVDFQKAIQSGDVDAAIALYQGPLLDGFYIKDAPDFEQWLDGERAEAARRFADALRAGAGSDVSRWRRLIALDAFDNRNVIGLMDALVANGDRAGALHQARTYAELLNKEFGAQPDAEVEARAASIRNSGEAGAIPDTRRQASGSKQRPRPLWPLATGALLLILLFMRFFMRAPADEVSETVAIMPFRNITADRSAAYFADGMAQQLLSILTRVPGVDVVPMSSTTMFRDSATAPAQMGAALHAGYLLQGQLQKNGARLRVWVQLVRARDGRATWNEQYDVAFDDVFAVQDTIAARVARGMARTLQPAALPASSRTENMDAYSLYTHGSVELEQRTPESMQTALQDFKRAVTLDSTYAPAYVGLADTYNMLGSYDYGGLDPSYAYPHAREAARRALSLNAQIDRAHAALGTAYANYDWRAALAEKEFQTALRLNSHNSSARQWYALMLAAHQRFAEAEQQTATATRYDPLSPLAFVNRAHVLYYAQSYDSAAIMLDRALALDKNFNRAHVLYALVDLQRGREQEALTKLQYMLSQSHEPVLMALTAYALGCVGNFAEAREKAALLEETAAAQYVPPELRALAALAIQDHERAFAFLEEALRRRSGGLPYLAVEPMMSALSKDVRFRKLVAATRN